MAKKDQHKVFRFQTDHVGRFDELVVGKHVHLEMMDPTNLWVRIGNKVCFINIKTGKATPFEDYA